MSEDNASTRKQKDHPAEVWGELDDSTRERVIEIFVDMAFRIVHSQLQSPREGLLPEDGNKAVRSHSRRSEDENQKGVRGITE